MEFFHTLLANPLAALGALPYNSFAGVLVLWPLRSSPGVHSEPSAATDPALKNLYRRQIEATDQQIDALVYELYGLTEEE